MKTVFLKISNTEIHFNETDSIPIENTTIPSKYIRFNTEYKDIFWEVELLKFDHESKLLSVRVIDYNPQNIRTFRDQKSNFPLSKILFDVLDWKQVEKQLSSYTPSVIKDIFFGVSINQEIDSRDSSWATPKSSFTRPGEFEPVSDLPIEKDSKTIAFKSRYEEVHRINILDFRFYEGFVSTSKRLKNTPVPTELVIHNYVFRQEFEYIKDYFVKHFRRKTVKVYLEYEIESGQVKNIKSRCPDLEGIDDSVIEAIKVKRTNILRRPSTIETKTILDLEEIFLIMNDPSAGKNVFEQSEKDIINHFINIDGIRNKQQLSYLVNELLLGTEKIRFTIHPVFGFVIFYKTNNNSYFIWELLDSHATYIWYAENSALSKMSLFMEFEKAIEYIKGLGRENYKQAYKEGIINETIQFKSIYHKRNKVSGIKDWKEKLASILNE